MSVSYNILLDTDCNQKMTSPCRKLLPGCSAIRNRPVYSAFRLLSPVSESQFTERRKRPVPPSVSARFVATRRCSFTPLPLISRSGNSIPAGFCGCSKSFINQTHSASQPEQPPADAFSAFWPQPGVRAPPQKQRPLWVTAPRPPHSLIRQGTGCAQLPCRFPHPRYARCCHLRRK